MTTETLQQHYTWLGLQKNGKLIFQFSYPLSDLRITRSNVFFVFFYAGYYIRQVSSLFLGLLLAYLSIPVVQNLLSSKQMMNTSFDSLRIVNTYGAFGRYVAIICSYNKKFIGQLQLLCVSKPTKYMHS